MKRNWIVLLLVGALAMAACGGGSSTAAGTSTIKIKMKDIAFEPTSIQVRKGDTVTFEFNNTGAIVHEAFIGDAAAQDAHAMEMSSASMSGSDSMAGHGSSGGHGGADMLTVEAGKTANVTHTFDTAGSFIIGCHQPGHFEAGMKVTVIVQ